VFFFFWGGVFFVQLRFPSFSPLLFPLVVVFAQTDQQSLSSLKTFLFPRWTSFPPESILHDLLVKVEKPEP